MTDQQKIKELEEELAHIKDIEHQRMTEFFDLKEQFDRLQKDFTTLATHRVSEIFRAYEGCVQIMEANNLDPDEYIKENIKTVTGRRIDD